MARSTYTTKQARAIVVDDNGNSYITGFCFGGVSSSLTFGNVVLMNADKPGDIFVAKLDAAGTWQWAAQAGGIDKGYLTDDRGFGIARTASGVLYLTGSFRSLNPNFGAYSITNTNTFSAASRLDATYLAQMGGQPLATQSGRSAATRLEVWPNPAGSAPQLVRVRLPAGSGPLRLLDATGREVRCQLLPASAVASEATISVAGLAAGLYVVRYANQVQQLLVDTH